MTKPLFHILLPLLLLSCAREPAPDGRQSICFVLRPAGALTTRAADPGEDRISDYNLLIYNCFGVLEEKVYVPARLLEGNDAIRYRTTLLKDVPYTLLVAANLGYELPLLSLDEMRSYRYNLAYPDEFSQGLPLVAFLENWTADGACEKEVPLERLFARVDLRIDRRALDADVQLDITQVRVGGCPSSVQLAAPSKAQNDGQVFRIGYTKSGTEVNALARDETPGLSQPLSLYLLENCQGNLLEQVETDQGKVLPPPYRDLCSYIEIRGNYSSDNWHTAAGQKLIYRFYLGESRNNFDVRRNNWYRVTVRPEGSGLNEDSWRVDKSGLEAERRFVLHPAAYNECRSGDDFHIWCEVRPQGTEMYIEPLAYAEDPRVAALYQYTVDEDGNGLTIHTHKGGSAVIYFRAGPPVNRDTLAMLVIDP